MYNPQKQERAAGGRFGGRKKVPTITIGQGPRAKARIICPVELRIPATVYLAKLENAKPGEVVPVPAALANNRDVQISYIAQSSDADDAAFERLGRRADEALNRTVHAVDFRKDEALINPWADAPGLQIEKGDVTKGALGFILLIIAAAGLLVGCIKAADALF